MDCCVYFIAEFTCKLTLICLAVVANLFALADLCVIWVVVLFATDLVVVWFVGGCLIVLQLFLFIVLLCDCWWVFNTLMVMLFGFCMFVWLGLSIVYWFTVSWVWLDCCVLDSMLFFTDLLFWFSLFWFVINF